MCAGADCTSRNDGGARATSGCDIHSQVDPDCDTAANLVIDAVANLYANPATDFYTDSAPNLNTTAADSSGHCC